jgi:PAS domain S-box-containing protein
MSPLYWLDVAALGTSLLISSSLALMVLGFGPGRALNRRFALFAALQAVWAGFSLLLRLSLWLERGNPQLFGELATLSLSLMGIALLLFAVRYVRYRARWADLAAALGLVAIAGLSIPLFQHRLIFDPRLDANGSTTMNLSTFGLLAAALPTLYFVWSLILFWRGRRRTRESYLAYGMLVLVFGFLVGGVLEIPFPVLSVTNTIGVAVLGYGVVSRQLFNPLRESEERFRTIFDGLNDAVFIHDVNTGAIVDVNAKMCEMYGYTHEQALQVDTETLSSGEAPYTQREAMAWMRKALEEGPQIFDWQARDKGGRLFWVEVNIRQTTIGGRDRLLVTVRDTTDRKRAEKALRESEEKFRTLAEQSPNMIFINRGGRVVYANRCAEELVGYGREEYYAAGFDFLSLIAAEHRDLVKSAFARHGRGQEVPPYEYALVTKDGRRIEAIIATRLINYEGGRAILGVVTDITERKGAEEALRSRTAELEERNKELDAFAHTVAHDLQNPLGMVIGFAETLEQSYARLPEKELQRYLRAVTRSGRRMSNIIDELLLLARMRKMELEAMPLDMASVVAGAEQRLADMIERYQAEIVSPDTWPVALGYSPWVEEIWVNYLSNALKYGGRPPRIELGADWVTDGPAGDSMLRFWVRDNGPGLTPEEQAQLFVPFTQLAKIQVKGHGLGLSIVQRIAEKLGGRVGVESEVGKGSIFWFSLPAQ